MPLFLKATLPDYLLCVIASASLSFTVCSGFYSTQPYQDAMGIVLVGGLCALLTAALFVTARSNRTALIGSIALTGVIIAAFAACLATSTVAEPLDDQPGNSLYLAFCIVVPTLAVFLLSRRRMTALVLIVLGVLACAVIEYLYWYGHVIAFATFLVSSVALYVYRTYQRSVLASDSERLAFGSVTAAGVLLAAFAAAWGICAFALAIAPLEPPNLTVKLITEHYRPDEVEVRGVGATKLTPDDELESSNESEENQQSNNQEDDADFDDESESGDDAQNTLGFADSNPLGSIGGGLAGLFMNTPRWFPFALLAGIVLLVALVIALKKALRRRRYLKMVGGNREDAVSRLYQFFLDRFKRLGLPEVGTMTLAEYVGGNAEALSRFEGVAAAGASPTFADLTQIYVGQVFGGEPSGEEDLAAFEDYYGSFYKRACAYLGRWRYCRKFFRL